MGTEEKMGAHKSVCHQCRMANDVNAMCRNGRRLFIAWLRSLDEDTRTSMLLGMPEDICMQLTEALDMPGFITIEPPTEPPKEN